MAKRFKAAVIGGSGYGGAELIRRLLVHPDVELVRVASIDYIGEPLSTVHPNLEGRTDLKFEGIEAADAARGMDVVLLGLPHKVSAHRRPRSSRRARGSSTCPATSGCAIPPSTRSTTAPSTPAPTSSRKARSSTGCPRSTAKPSRRRYVASPGCFATAIELLFCRLPAGLLRAPSRSSGSPARAAAASRPQRGTHHPARANNLKTYKPLEHQHVPEVVADAHRGGREEPDASLRARERAAVARHFRDVLCARRREDAPPRNQEALCRDVRERAVRTRPRRRLPEVVSVKERTTREVGVQTGRRERRPASCRVLPATDNLDQGGSGTGHPVDEPHARPGERLTLEDPGGWP